MGWAALGAWAGVLAGLSGLLDHLPDEMVDERVPARLFDAQEAVTLGLLARAEITDSASGQRILRREVVRQCSHMWRPEIKPPSNAWVDNKSCILVRLLQ